MKAAETLVESTDERLRHLDEEIRTLTAARGALEGREAPAVHRRQRGAASRVSRTDNGAGAESAGKPGGETAAAASREMSLRSRKGLPVRARSKPVGRRSSTG
jgi:hypothetical protein